MKPARRLLPLLRLPLQPSAEEIPRSQKGGLEAPFVVYVLLALLSLCLQGFDSAGVSHVPLLALKMFVPAAAARTVILETRTPKVARRAQHWAE